jgi:hypothetical protein
MRRRSSMRFPLSALKVLPVRLGYMSGSHSAGGGV